MRDVLLIVDVLGNLSREDGEELLASLGERHEDDDGRLRRAVRDRGS
jgi:hypothetical protein